MSIECCCKPGFDCRKNLAELPVGAVATVVGILPQSRGCKKFADAGIVPGVEVQVEAHAPLGSLIRIKVMESSVALNKVDAACIMIEIK